MYTPDTAFEDVMREAPCPHCRSVDSSCRNTLEHFFFDCSARGELRNRIFNPPAWSIGTAFKATQRTVLAVPHANVNPALHNEFYLEPGEKIHYQRASEEVLVTEGGADQSARCLIGQVGLSTWASWTASLRGKHTLRAEKINVKGNDAAEINAAEILRRRDLQSLWSRHDLLVPYVREALCGQAKEDVIDEHGQDWDVIMADAMADSDDTG